MKNIYNLISISYIWQKRFSFLIDHDLLNILLLVHWLEKVLAKIFRKDVLICRQSTIMVRLCEIKIFISKGIYKFLVDLIWINITLKPSIVFSIIFWRFYKAYISSSIIYYDAPFIQSLVPDVFIEVYVVIWDKKMLESSFVNNLFYDGYSIDLQTALDRLIWNYYIHLIKRFNRLFWYVVGKSVIANNFLEYIEALILTTA